MTQDLSNPTTLSPVCLAGAQGGGGSTGYVTQTQGYTFASTLQGIGLALDNVTHTGGPYGSNTFAPTVFLDNQHSGLFPNDSPANIIALDWQSPYNQSITLTTTSLINRLINNVYTPKGVDFETGGQLTQCIASSGNAAAENTTVLDPSGSYSLELNRPYPGAVGNVTIGQDATHYLNCPTAYYSFLFEFTGSQTTDAGICNFQDTQPQPNTGLKGSLHLNPSHQLVFGTAAIFTGSTVLQPGQIYTITVKVGTGTSTAPFQVLLNGNLELSGTGNLGANNNGSILLGGGSAYTSDFFYDDVVVRTGYISLPESMSIYHTSGGSGYNPAIAPAKPATDAQAYSAAFTPGPTVPVTGLASNAPGATPVLLISDSIPRQPGPQPTSLSTGSDGIGRVGPQDHAIDSLFADWNSALVVGGV